MKEKKKRMKPLSQDEYSESSHQIINEYQEPPRRIDIDNLATRKSLRFTFLFSTQI